MPRPEPDTTPELGQYKSTIEIRETSGSDGETLYKATWRGLTACADSVPRVLDRLSADIRDQG